MWSARRLSLALLVCGLVAAVAALFGPAETWDGLDLGSLGAGVFVLTLGGLVWLFATRGDSIFPEQASIMERRAWVGLAFLGVMLVTFFRELLVLAGQGIVPGAIDDLLAHRFIQRFVVLGIAWALISHFVRGQDGGVETDERDLRMRHRADRAGDWALTLIVIGGIVALASVPADHLTWWLAPIVLANVLIGLLIAKSLVEHVVLAYSYRRSTGQA